MKNNNIDYISSLPDFEGCTVNDVVKYCYDEAEKKGQNTFDFKKIIDEAISFGYDKRYLCSDRIDERDIIKKEFQKEISLIIKKLGASDEFLRGKVLIVGAGNGYECELLYSKNKNISVVDVAPNILQHVKTILPKAKTYKCNANNLETIPDSYFDYYISLRTYQSTYFDISSSLREAKRILKDNASIIISIACGYLDEENNFVYGLFNPHKGILERERPQYYTKKITNDLKELNFKIIGIEKIPTEIFIFAQNC